MPATKAPVPQKNAGVSDAGFRHPSYLGVDGARVTSADASGGVNVTNAPASDEYLWLTDLIVSVAAAMRVDVKEETTGTILASLYMPANSTYNLVTRGKIQLQTAGKRVQVATSTSGNISVTSLYSFEK